jgi:hypothetical protein
MRKQNGKRILSVKLVRDYDDSPDTSHLGEYSNRPETEYAIDRAHSEDCASVREDVKQAKQTLEHVQQTIGDLQKNVPFSEEETSEYQALENAYTEVGELFDSIDECDCGERGDMERNQYRYFNGPVENYEGESPKDIRKYIRQDYDRMESLNRGDWGYICIQAKAEIITCTNKAGLYHGPVQIISSGSLCGIESDSSKTYFEEIEEGQLAELKSQLRGLGFSTRAISKAFQSIERKDS